MIVSFCANDVSDDDFLPFNSSDDDLFMYAGIALTMDENADSDDDT